MRLEPQPVRAIKHFLPLQPCEAQQGYSENQQLKASGSVPGVRQLQANPEGILQPLAQVCSAQPLGIAKSPKIAF